MHLLNKKSVRTCTCHSSHVLRSSHYPIDRNEQRRPHADMYIYDTTIRIQQGLYSIAYGYMTYPVASTVALFLINQLKVAKFQNVKTKALSKRLSKMSSPPYLLRSHKGKEVSA